MPYSLVKGEGGYFVVSPHGHYLSKHPLTKEDAMKQETAVRLTELRREHKLPERTPSHHSHQSHTHHLTKHKEEGMKEVKTDAEGMVFVPVSRDVVHRHQILPTRDIFAPLPLPVHYLRKDQHYATTGM